MFGSVIPKPTIFFVNTPIGLNKKDITGKGLKRPDCIILDSYVFENFMLADEPFAKILQSLETCVSVNNNLCRKLVSSWKLPTTTGEWFKVTSVSFFILDFNLLICELENFTFQVLHLVVL